METKPFRFADVRPHTPISEQALCTEPRPSTPAAEQGHRRPRANASRILLRAAFAFAVLALPAAALGANIKGKITGAAKLLNPVWNEAKESSAHRYTFREPSPTVRPDVRNLTSHLPKELCIVALGEKGEALKVPLRVTISGGRTTPVTLVVAEGQQVQFENRDPFPHKLGETSGKGGFVAAEIAPTKSRAWTPPGPGKYEFRDALAPSIRSWIVVEPKTVAIAYPDRKGDFSIEVPPGTYKLRGYHNGEAVGKELEVTVQTVDIGLNSPLIVGEGDANAAGGK